MAAPHVEGDADYVGPPTYEDEELYGDGDETEEEETPEDDDEYSGDYVGQPPKEGGRQGDQGHSGHQPGSDSRDGSSGHRGSPSPSMPSPSPARSGRNGPRTSPEESPQREEGRPRVRDMFTKKSNDGAASHASEDSLASKSKVKSEKSSSSQRKPRGNLPQAPKFSGDRKADPACFKKYANTVDSYVAIAEKIINPGEIGLRLHAALEGEAESYLEDVPARAFGEADGWKVLLRVLREKFDETKMAKVGTAMKNFFKLQLENKESKEKAMTMRDVVDLMDKAARQCRDAGLTIPDAVMVYFFFEHSNASHERQANLLLRTNGAYDWSLIKKAVDLLYPTVTVRPGATAGKGGYGRARGAHEVQNDAWSGDWPMPEATDPQLDEWLEYYDPVEHIAENFAYDDAEAPLPEELARELHTVFTSHRENRQKLAKAVQARGYYVKGKSKGKGKKGGKTAKGGGKGKKGGKTRGGLTLEELKAKTACGDCGQVGHWHGDAACPMRKANMTGGQCGDEEQHYDEAEETYDWHAEWNPYGAEDWTHDAQTSSAARGSQATRRVAHQAHRTSPVRDELHDEAYETAKNITMLKSKRSGSTPSDRNPKSLRSDDMELTANYLYVRGLLEASKSSSSSASSGPAAVQQARDEVANMPKNAKSGKTYEELGSVWELLKDMPVPDVDALRVRQTYVTRTINYADISDLEDDEMIPDGSPRTVFSLLRRRPTVMPGRAYLTIDTACENTVCGSNYAQKLLDMLYKFNIVPTAETENEHYCFGPGAPQTSVTRLAVPVGIGDVAAVVKTSVIQEDKLYGSVGPNGIPFLAGQDWLLMMGAVIDIGNSAIEFPLIGVKVPLYVDHTGHLVVAIDEFPNSGWPHQAPFALEEYPGAVFAVVEKKERNRSSCAVDSSPDYIYEPNHDSMNQDLSNSPVRVPPDFWEYTYHGMVIRHHCRPRNSLFDPVEAHDRPDTQVFRGERITIRAGGEHEVDMWQSSSSSSPTSHDAKWTGMTCFLLKDADVKNMKLPPVPQFGVEVVFPDGSHRFVHPSSLTTSQHDKRINTFDIGGDNHMFEHAASTKQTRFVIPQGQFGSKLVQGNTDDEKVIHCEDKMQPNRDVAAHRPQVVHFDEDDAAVDPQQQDDQGDEAPFTGSGGLRRGYDGQKPGRSRRDDTSGDPASINHQRQGAD